MVILGIDPGSRITGYGIIAINNNVLSYLASGCIKTCEATLAPRLPKIFYGICELLEEFEPDEVSIEEVFIHTNPAAALKLGHARGVAMVAAASHRKPIFEYTPREIKLAATGYGGAEKSQVKQMIMQLLQLKKPPQDDASDALAIAICHHHSRQGSSFKRSKSRRTRR